MLSVQPNRYSSDPVAYTDEKMKPFITIGSLTTDSPTVCPRDSVAHLKKVLADRGPLGTAVVVKQQRPVGLVMSHHLNQLLSLQYGQSLFLKKSVSQLMDAAPLIVSTTMNLENVAALAMQREEEKIYDNIIITDTNGIYRGVVSVHAILRRMTSLEKVRVEALKAGNRVLEQEIREKRQIQKDLLDSQSRLRLVIDTIPQAIYWKNRKLSYVGFNKIFLRDSGLKHESDLIGKTDLELSRVSDEAKFSHENDRRVVQTGLADFHVIEPKMKPDGGRLYFDVSRIPLFDDNDRVDGLLVMYADITEKVLGKQEKAALEAQLRKAEKMEAIGTLAGGIAHDLNNILSGVVSYPQILLLDLPEKSPFFRPLQQIQQSGERAAAIVHDLLTMARRAVETMTPVTLAAVIDDYFQSPEFIKLQANHPGVHLSYHNQSPEIRILGARHQLSKVVMNLVSNAAEATAPSGDVKVSLTLSHLPEAHSGYEDVPPGHYAVIDVTDTGTGINVNDMGRIFEPFYTKKNMGHSGTGLGLAVVWGIVKDHGGFIDIRTQKDRGTIFSLYFPKTDQANGSGEQMMKLEDYMGQGESILVVDDVVEQRQIAEIMLKRLGYTVTTVKSGEEALQLTDKKPFDVLLLDMIMEPGIDGLETYKHILEVRPEQKAIIVSGYSETRRVQHALRMGASAYIRKPYSIEKIGIAMRKALHHRRDTICNSTTNELIN